MSTCVTWIYVMISIGSFNFPTWVKATYEGHPREQTVTPLERFWCLPDGEAPFEQKSLKGNGEGK